jgi:hypothetical protein
VEEVPVLSLRIHRAVAIQWHGGHSAVTAQTRWLQNRLHAAHSPAPQPCSTAFHSPAPHSPAPHSPVPHSPAPHSPAPQPSTALLHSPCSAALLHAPAATPQACRTALLNSPAPQPCSTSRLDTASRCRYSTALQAPLHTGCSTALLLHHNPAPQP